MEAKTTDVLGAVLMTAAIAVLLMQCLGLQSEKQVLLQQLQQQNSEMRGLERGVGLSK